MQHVILVYNKQEIVNYTGSHTCCEISCFLKTTAKKLGDQYIVVPNLKVGGPVSPCPHGCCAYASWGTTGTAQKL